MGGDRENVTVPVIFLLLPVLHAVVMGNEPAQLALKGRAMAAFNQKVNYLLQGMYTSHSLGYNTAEATLKSRTSSSG